VFSLLLGVCYVVFLCNEFFSFVPMCVCVQRSFESRTKIVKLGLKNVVRFVFEWNNFFNGLAKETNTQF
jgi:hypothetical protein